MQKINPPKWSPSLVLCPIDESPPYEFPYRTVYFIPGGDACKAMALIAKNATNYFISEAMRKAKNEGNTQ